MPSPLKIRHANPADLSTLLDLYAQLSPDNAPLSSAAAKAIFAQIARYEGSAILLGEVDETIVVSCTVIVIPNLTRGGRPYALIENVITDADHRRRGYANLLLDAATTQASGHGCYKVMLMTGTREPATLAAYQRAGFEQSKTGFQKRRLPKRQ